MRAELEEEVAKLKEKGIVPGLGVILVGEDPASQSYVRAKEKACENIGIFSDDNRLPADTSQEDLIALVKKMNNDPKINGILVQLPVPKGLDESEVLAAGRVRNELAVFDLHLVPVETVHAGIVVEIPLHPPGFVEYLPPFGQRIEIYL